jgi:hypothetical protein
VVRALLLFLLACCSFAAVADNGVHTSRELAYAHCDADAAPQRTANFDFRCEVSPAGSANYRDNIYQLPGGTFYSPAPGYWSWDASAECPSPATWDETSHTCKAPNNCPAKAPLIGVYAKGGDGTICSDGCEFQTGGGVGITLGGNTYSSGSWTPSGNACSANSKPPSVPFDPSKPVCVSNGESYATCVQPDGTHCVSSPSGAQLCWKPGETGPRITTDGTLGGNHQPANTPTPPPDNQVGPVDKSTTTTTTTINNVTTTTTTTITSGTGNTGGQANTGTGGTDSKGGKPTGNPTAGGSGDGKDGNGTGTAVSGFGTGLYTKTQDTIPSVYAEFKTAVQNAPIIHAADSFFSYSGGGACPVFTVPATAYWQTLTFDYLCKSPLSTLLQFGGYMVLAVAAFKAFKIAVY